MNIKFIFMPLVLVFLTSCAALPVKVRPPESFDHPISELQNDDFVTFKDLPKPKNLATIAVSFSDKTGKRGDSSSDLSTVISQGLDSTVMKAIQDSGYFRVVEREGLNNVLTERKIIEMHNELHAKKISLPSIIPAKFLLKGAVISYQRNVRNGGLGGAYTGWSGDLEVWEDKLTISMRIISPKNALVLYIEPISKTIFSVKVHAGLFKFLDFKKLAEGETGLANTELVQRCIYEAIKQSLKNIILEMILTKKIELKNPSDLNSEVIRDYINRQKKEKIK